METNKVSVTEERISHFVDDHSIHLCFPANISEPDSSLSDDPKVFSPSIPSFFPATISSDSDNGTSVILDELSLQQFCPSIQSIFPATPTQRNSPTTNDEITPYHPIELCFPPRCSDSDDSIVSSGINVINRYLRSFSIQSYFPPRKSSSVTSMCDHPIFPSPSPRHDSDSISILEKPNLKAFTFTDLKSATKNFKSDTLLGNGAFGKVFKGCMDEKRLSLSPSNKVGTRSRKSSMLVAIKKLTSKTTQDFQEWQQSEINFLGSLLHPNLVKLLGYCWEDKDLFLVYEFMQKGSLHNHLCRRNNCEPLSWDIRLKIAIEVAQGLTFLNSLEKQVIHRYVKASNILLDGNFNAKISDFGLARLGPSMYGYAAPEYISIGHLYVKSDVYAFGVVLLEMLTGLRELDTKGPSGQKKLIDWLKPCLSTERQLKTIMDVRMEGQYSSKAALQVAQLTLKCLELDPTNRPSMKDVVEALECIEPIKEKPKETKINSTYSIAHGHGQRPIHHDSPLHVGNHGAETW